MMNYFKFGSGKIPDWMADRVMMFCRADGSVGYELWGKYANYTLRPGDVIVRDDCGRIKLMR